MNKDKILKYSTPYEDDLLEDLQDPEFAQYYLEAALDDYRKDSDAESLLIAMRDVAEAQGGIGKLAKQAGMSRQQLDDVLNRTHNPKMDSVLGILATLGIRVDHLEHHEAADTPKQERASVAT